MNETIKTILERKSCRSYTDEQVPEELLKTVVDCGLAAPSGRNRQPVFSVVIQDKTTIEKLSKINASIMGVESDPFYGAPTVIVVLAKAGERTSLEDGCLVLGNMLTAAYALGLGACWIHRARETFETPEGKDLLRQWGITEEVFGVGNCILGYPDGDYHADFEKLASRAVVIK